jgi:hypothetical protein
VVFLKHFLWSFYLCIFLCIVYNIGDFSSIRLLNDLLPRHSGSSDNIYWSKKLESATYKGCTKNERIIKLSHEHGK